MEKMDKKTNSQDQLVKQFDSKEKKAPWPKLIALLLVVIVLGAGSGVLIAKGTAGTTAGSNEVTKASDVEKGKAFGVNDKVTFSDDAEGVLKEGGIEGEGQYHLERPGGETQYVYLTSSVVDLSLVKGRKVKVWGQTQKAQHAPWLMDVGRVEVLE